MRFDGAVVTQLTAAAYAIELGEELGAADRGAALRAIGVICSARIDTIKALSR